MADISVTLTTNPIQVTATTQPISVITSTPGPAGPPGGQGIPGVSNLSNSITGISISGGLGFTGNFNILAGTNITLSQAGNSLTIIAASTSTDISGLISTGNADLRYLTTGSSGSFYTSNSEQRIRTEIPSGSGQLFINYVSNFNSIPLIWCQVQTSGNGINYYVNSSGVQINGYTAVFSDIIRETGVLLHSLVKLL